MSMGCRQLVCCCFLILAGIAVISHAHATAGISVQRNEVHWNKKGGMLLLAEQLLGKAHWQANTLGIHFKRLVSALMCSCSPGPACCSTPIVPSVVAMLPQSQANAEQDGMD
jgi:hypothetical protein